MRPLEAVLFDLGNTLLTYPSPDESLSPENINGVDVVPLLPLFKKPLEVTPVSPEEIKRRLISAMNRYRESRTLARGFEEFGLEATVLRALEEEFPTMENLFDMWQHKEVLKSIAYELYRQLFNRETSLLPFALELLEFVFSHRLKIGLISNTPWPAAFHLEDMQRFGILHFFDPSCMLFSSEEGLRKPHGAPFYKALGALGVDQASKAVFVGDSRDRDIEGAARVGIRKIWFRDGSGLSPVPFSRDWGFAVSSVNSVNTLHEAGELIDSLMKKKKVEPVPPGEY